jgi:DNA-binding NtrC family response regulator
LISNEILDALRRHPWPGNVRELENVIQRAVILSPGGRLTLPPILVEPAPQSPPKEPDTLEGIERA